MGTMSACSLDKGRSDNRRAVGVEDVWVGLFGRSMFSKSKREGGRPV
jgi:hypothetical protein